MKEKSYTRHGYIIINPYGSIWSVDLFDTVDDAQKCINDCWLGKPNADNFKVVPGKAEITRLDKCETCGKPLDEK